MSQSPEISPPPSPTSPPSSSPKNPQTPITPLAQQLTTALNLGPGSKAPPRRPLNDKPIPAPDSLSAKGKFRSSLGVGLGLPPADQDIDETIIDMGKEGDEEVEVVGTPVRTLDFAEERDDEEVGEGKEGEEDKETSGKPKI